MIRSDVGVTGFAPLGPDRVYVPEPERVVVPTCFEVSRTGCGTLCAFVITVPFGISVCRFDAHHMGPTRGLPTSPSLER